MTTITYKLIAFSRDVNLSPLPNGKHSGYGLVKIENGQAVAMKTFEVVGDGLIFSNMNMITSSSCDIIRLQIMPSLEVNT